MYAMGGIPFATPFLPITHPELYLDMYENLKSAGGALGELGTFACSGGTVAIRGFGYRILTSMASWKHYVLANVFGGMGGISVFSATSTHDVKIIIGNQTGDDLEAGGAEEEAAPATAPEETEEDHESP